MIAFVFAFVAGLLTIAAPCILPLLPIVLGASLGGGGSKHPIFIALGFVVAFSAVALVLGTFIETLGLSPDVLHTVTVFMLVVFGVLMIVPRLFEPVVARLSGSARSAPRRPISRRAVHGRMATSRASTPGLRDELLNGEIFYSLKEAQIVIESWRRHYNAVRPHQSLGYRPPAPEVFVPALAAWPSTPPRSAPPATLTLASKSALN